MARKSGVEWRAVGASLDDLARTMRTIPAGTPGAFAFANSGILQQAGVVVAARYIEPGTFAERKGSRFIYSAPPGGTHGPITRGHRNKDGSFNRNARGQFVDVATEQKLFIKGKFVTRSGHMLAAARELARTAPTERVDTILTEVQNPRHGDTGGIEARIDSDGKGILTLSGGYRAAEVGSRNSISNGVKGWWRAIRSVNGRWATMLKKKYPDLLKIRVGA